MLQPVKFSNYYDIVTKSKLPVIVEFFAPWCDHCEVVTPLLEKLSEEYEGKIIFCTVDIEEEDLLSMKNKIKQLPTLAFIKKGDEVKRTMGEKTYEEIKFEITNF